MHGDKVRRALDADDLDSAWALLEECLTRSFGDKATQPRARITLREAHPNTTFEGDAVTVELSVCQTEEKASAAQVHDRHTREKLIRQAK